MNNLWNRSVGPFDEAAAQRHRHMGLLDCNGDVNSDAVNFLAHLCAGLSLRHRIVPEFIYLDIRHRRGRRRGIAVGCYEQRPR